jgi:FkbM family methyltransferase
MNSALRHVGRRTLSAYQRSRGLLWGNQVGWKKTSAGFAMLIDPSDPDDRAFCLGLYERALVRLIEAVVRPGDLCIDVGGHKGFISLHLAKAVGPEGRVISIEPDPRAMQILTANCRRNRAANVELYSCLLGNESRMCEFSLSTRLGWSSMFPNELAQKAVSRTISIQTRTLDDLIGEAGVADSSRLSLVKMDVEGAEPLVLAGALRTLATFRPVVHFEVNEGSLRAAGKSSGEIADFFFALGYKLYEIKRAATISGFVYRYELAELPPPGSSQTKDIVALIPGQHATTLGRRRQ